MKIRLQNIALLAGAAALWDWAGACWEMHKTEQAYDYWRLYYDQATLKKADALCQTYAIRSTGVTLHLDVFPHPDPRAPVCIFNHGGGGYSRMFWGAALILLERGYTVILPNQKGQGLSGGRRGDYSVAECTQNIIDVARWAKTRFNTSIYMAGASLGGGLTYYAASAGAPVKAIACVNLFDYSNIIDGLGVSRLAWMTKITWLPRMVGKLLPLLSPFAWLRIPFKWFGVMEKIIDKRNPVFQALWDADPFPNRLVSIRALLSLSITPPAVPFEENTKPVLVINQTLDEMTDPSVTRRNYERMGGPKDYLEIPFGHWSNDPDFWRMIVNASDQWFKAHS